MYGGSSRGDLTFTDGKGRGVSMRHPIVDVKLNAAKGPAKQFHAAEWISRLRPPHH
jgi:hypothetical protein